MSDEPVETGLAGLDVTATVTAPVQVPAVVPLQVPSAPMPEGWTIHRVAALVRDLAVNMYDLPFTLSKHSLTDEQYETLRQNDFFKKAIEAATIEWNSPLSTPKRLAMEAAIALEDALPDVAMRLRKTNEPLPGVVELAKLFAKMAGVGEQSPGSQAPQEKFKITINLGADVAQFDKTRSNLIIEAGAQTYSDGEVSRYLEGPKEGS